MIIWWSKNERYSEKIKSWESPYRISKKKRQDFKVIFYNLIVLKLFCNKKKILIEEIQWIYYEKKIQVILTQIKSWLWKRNANQKSYIKKRKF